MKNSPASQNLSSIRDNRKRGSAFNYINTKQIPEIYRLVCQAVNEISRLFKERTAQKRISDRGTLLIPKSTQVNDMNNFELFTWLIIK